MNEYFKQEPSTNAQAEFASLHELVEEADIATAQEFHEDAWNHHVYSPLLKRVFPTLPPEFGEDARARLLAGMSVRVLNAYLPTQHIDRSATTGSSISESISETNFEAASDSTATGKGRVATA